MKRWFATIVLTAPLMLLGADSSEIRSILENRIDLAKKAVGIVVGTIDEKGRAVIGYGKLAKDRDEKPDGDTVFEIGSITKVFTSLILADMVERGEVKLDDPVSKFLPASVTVPSRCAYLARYSLQVMSFTVIRAPAWASAIGSPPRSSARSSASIRWSGKLVSRALR